MQQTPKDIIDAVVSDFETDWLAVRAGTERTVSIKASLDRIVHHVGKAFCDEGLRELLLSEIELRRDAGEVPKPEDYYDHLADVPNHRQIIDDVFLASTISRNSHGNAKASEDSAHYSGLRFRILRPHAEGGLGRVSVAHDEELHREVALKEIKPQFSKDLARRSRFTLEAEITGGLEHPGIVPVYGLGQYSDGRPYYAMRFIRGDSLKEAIEQFHGQLRPKSVKPEPALADVSAQALIRAETGRSISSDAFGSVEFRKLLGRFIDVCQAIEYAHSRGVLHRDLKPGNIMLGKYGETLVVDWGLAKAGEKIERFQESDEPMLVPSSGSAIEPTQMGSVIGTPAYMSPEQAESRLDRLGSATDVYSLGATLYHMLTGGAPLANLSLKELLVRVKRGEFPRPRELNSHIPRALEAVCMKAMSLRPEDRYAGAAEIAEELEHWLADEPVRALHEALPAQAARWFRKHRTSAMSAVAAVLIVAVVAMVAALLIHGQKQVITNLAEQKSKLADEKSTLAEQEKAARKKADLNAGAALRQQTLAKRHLYFAHMNLAQSAWEQNNVGQTIRLLDLYRPIVGQAGGSEDLRGFEWYYWDRCCHGDLLTLKGHADAIVSVMFSPDGKRLASASFDQTVKVWEAATGQESLTLKGHTAEIECVAFSPNGQRLASASDDWTVKVWDSVTGQETLTLKGHSGGIKSVAFSPDGQRLATASDDHTVKVWDAMTGQEMLNLNRHSLWVRGVAFSANGKLLASASGDHTVKIWEAATGRESLTLKGHTNDVRCVTFSPDGHRLASAGNDQTVRVWNAVTGQELLTLHGHTDDVRSVMFSPDGKRLASASEDQTVIVWDAGSDSEWLTLKGHTAGVVGVAFSPDGQRLASASSDRTLKVWDPAMSPTLLAMKAHTGVARSVVFSADGRRLASASEDQTIKVWETTTGVESLTLIGHTDQVTSVTFSPDGKHLASASTDHSVKVWDAVSGKESRTLQGHTDQVTSVTFSPDGKRMASASNDKTVKVWDATTGIESLTLRGHSAEVTSVAFSPDGKRLASASSDHTVKVWDVATGQKSLTLNGHTDAVVSVAFSMDGQRLASASYDKTVKLWDAVTGQESLTMKGHNYEVMSVAFSPDGRRLASASWDKTVKIWDAVTGQESTTLNGRTARVWSVAFSVDGQRLASASADGTVKVWDARPWTSELRVEQEALSLVRYYSMPPISNDELLGRIRTDATISEPVLKRALEYVRELPEKP